MHGVIIENNANLYSIIDENKSIYTATARGKFKNKEMIPTVGDKVQFDIIDDNKKTAVIEKIEPRINWIKRPKIANITQIIFVVSMNNPKPDLLLLDKQLAFAEIHGLKSIIVLNKCDIADKNEIESVADKYKKIGYEVIQSKAKQLVGINELREKLKNQMSVFSGNSGVGKSTIINSLFDKNITEEGQISHKSKRGKNTTTLVKLYELEENTYIADTPGFSTFELNEISNNELDMMFIEFRKYIEECRYVGCSHIYENIKECGVQRAAEEGKIAKSRYDNYCKIYEDIKSIKKY